MEFSIFKLSEDIESVSIDTTFILGILFFIFGKFLIANKIGSMVFMLLALSFLLIVLLKTISRSSERKRITEKYFEVIPKK